MEESDKVRPKSKILMNNVQIDQYYALDSRKVVYICLKNYIEKVIAFAAALVLLPLCILIALFIRIDSKGPIIFMQERAGQSHLPFKILKFRTMRSDAPNLSTEEMQRSGLNVITRLGSFLRRSSLDELPQLLNVLKGDMSLVGPRPALMTQSKVLQLREQCGIEQLKPGITGYAQATGRDDLEDNEKVICDLHYLLNLGLRLDIEIIWMTLASVVKGTGNK